MNNNLILLLLSLFTINLGTSSPIYQTSELDVDGDYVHNSTQMVFPKIIAEFNRTNITSFDESTTNIGVSYETKNANITLYIYPAEVAHADRLMQEFYKSLQSIATVSGKEVEATQYPFEYSHKGYTFVGLGAEIGKNDISKKSLLTVFECGKWFLKYRITSNQSDFSALKLLRDTLIKYFSPVDIVQRYPLKQKADIIFAPAILKDSLMMYSVMKSAFKHSAWVLHNVDSLQRCSGFPGLYLGEYTASLQAMVEGYKNRNKFGGPRDTHFIEYIATLSRIIDNGYLNEFVMDQHNMLLITPKDLNLNVDGYRKWAKDNVKSDILEGQLYIIEYKE